MCLIVFAFQLHPDYPLILAANRDEFYNRPTAHADFWHDVPQIHAGRDLIAGGTWLGVDRKGRFAAVTNYRSPQEYRHNMRSRGLLVKEFLLKQDPAREYLTHVQQTREIYAGFNLLIGDDTGLWYYSNRSETIQQLAPGIYGVSNHLLDTPWPKVTTGKIHLQRLLAQTGVLDMEQLFEILTDTNQPLDVDLPNTGVGLEWERKLAPLFIRTPDYGTRSSTLLVRTTNNELIIVERTYQPETGETATFERRFVCSG